MITEHVQEQFWCLYSTLVIIAFKKKKSTSFLKETHVKHCYLFPFKITVLSVQPWGLNAQILFLPNVNQLSFSEGKKHGVVC